MAQKTSAVRQVQLCSEGISCGYPSRHCEGPRARRRNGKLHRFCEYNRAKANLHQRALEERRRQQKLLEQHQHGTFTPDDHYRHLNEHLLQRHQGEDTLEFQTDYYFKKSEVKYVSEEDLRALKALLFKEGDSHEDFLK